MNTFKDDYYRKLCENPTSYDKVIDWIAKNNPAAARSTMYRSAEEFAAECVHSCIRSVIFSDTDNMWSATGMALALRASSHPDSIGYKQVILTIQL